MQKISIFQILYYSFHSFDHFEIRMRHFDDLSIFLDFVHIHVDMWKNFCSIHENIFSQKCFKNIWIQKLGFNLVAEKIRTFGHFVRSSSKFFNFLISAPKILRFDSASSNINHWLHWFQSYSKITWIPYASKMGNLSKTRMILLALFT